MDELENKSDVNSSETIILWKNHNFQDNLIITEDNDQKLDKYVKSYQTPPRMLGENYLYLISKTANDLIDYTVTMSKWIAQCSFISYKPGGIVATVGDKNENEAAYANYLRECKNKLLHVSRYDRSLLSVSKWLRENGTVNDHVTNISDYIKHSWNLDAKYLFTVETVNDSYSSDKNSTRHRYKVEFSTPTKTCIIPQITVTVFFTVELMYSLSLPVYIKYQLETDTRAYVVGIDRFDEKKFLRLFKIKRDAYINKYPGWSTMSKAVLKRAPKS